MSLGQKPYGKKISFTFAFVFSLIWGLFGFCLILLLDPVFIEKIKTTYWICFLIGVLTFILMESLRVNERVRRLERISRAALRFKKEDFHKKAPAEKDDELGVLAHILNTMADALRDRIHTVEGEKTKLSAIINNMAEGLLGVSEGKRVLIMNPRAEKILGVQSKEALGKSLLEVTKNPQVDELIDRAMRSHESIGGEIQFSFPSPKILKLNAIGLESAESDIAAIMVFYDVTKYRRLEKNRQEFVANVSHELKTPLTSIKGFIETLLGGAFQDPEKSQEFLRIIKEDTDRLDRLIEDLLDLSKIESRNLSLYPSTIDLRLEVDKVVAFFRPQLEKRGIQLMSQLDANQSIYADPDKLKQVLINLIDNAIKFNESGGQVMLVAEASAEGVEVSVRDTGIGIAEEHLPRLFERFYRADKSRGREVGGSGLGLSIVKHIVEAHGGRVSCQSQVGQGSTFKAFFPKK